MVANLARRRVASACARTIDQTVSPLVDLGDALVVSGFWRSGAGWLQNACAAALNAKTIYEPFSPKAAPPFQLRMQAAGVPDALREAYIPMAAEAIGSDGEAFLKDALRGYVHSRFAFVGRSGIRDALKTRVVVKFARAQFLLSYMADRFNAKTLHVSRHPCAVVASCLATDWDWRFEEIDFRALAALHPNAPESGDRELLVSVADAPVHVRLATYWALTERAAARRAGARVMYEEVLAGPTVGVMGALAALGLSDEAAPTTRAGVAAIPDGDAEMAARTRIYGWRDQLPMAVQNDVRGAVAACWPEAGARWFAG